jgi:transposase InsO family protein
MEDVLKNIYFNLDNPSSYTSVTGLHRAARLVDDNITKERVKLFLAEQEAYTMHKAIRSKFPTTPTVSVAKDQYWQIDLTDMSSISSVNNDIKFILFVIDVYTRYLWLRDLKNKKTETVRDALLDIFKVEETQPAYFWSDRGTEFVGRAMKEMLALRHIGLIHTTGVHKAAIVERSQRSLKQRMFRYFTYTHKKEYISKLQKFASAYNNSLHRTIKTTPFKAYKTSRMPRVKYSIKNTKRRFSFFPEGTNVRLSRPNQAFRKGYSLGGWTREIFVVTKIYKHSKIPMYKIKDLMNREIEGRFYTQELQRVIMQKKGDEMFHINKIIKTVGKGRKLKYLVSWLGYPSEFNSYISHNQIKKFH